MKSDWKIYVRILKTKATNFVNKEKRSIKKMGALILAVITFTGGTLIFYKILKFFFFFNTFSIII